jgi:hypothetical protein
MKRYARLAWVRSARLCYLSAIRPAGEVSRASAGHRGELGGWGEQHACYIRADRQENKGLLCARGVSRALHERDNLSALWMSDSVPS